MYQKELISISNCCIKKNSSIIINPFSWKMNKEEIWLIIGPNGQGKSNFIDALINNSYIYPQENGFYNNKFKNSTEYVSLELATKIIQEERQNNESEYITNGHALKDMSTGEIQKSLLSKTISSNKKLLILSNPFDGLDVQNRKIILDFINQTAKKQNPHLIIAMDRYNNVPKVITHVLEFNNKKISFCGKKDDYETLINTRKTQNNNSSLIKMSLNEVLNQVQNPTNNILVQMKNVNVSWGEHKVLINLNWQLNAGEHWLIRGPNGSGKTTLLELITGDNKQVYANNIKIFGIQRGSGETIWDIKKHLGIVSYRIHIEYRMIGAISLRDVIISGYKDSIGLYETPTETQIINANKWLSLGGFEGREKENFNNLSFGEQRAILILRSAVKNPKILILDEPCHGLDENIRNTVLCLIELIAQTKTTTILHVTHDNTEVLSFEKNILEFQPNQEPMYKIIKQQ